MILVAVRNDRKGFVDNLVYAFSAEHPKSYSHKICEFTYYTINQETFKGLYNTVKAVGINPSSLLTWGEL
jgi:hypothetical protein